MKHLLVLLKEITLYISILLIWHVLLVGIPDLFYITLTAHVMHGRPRSTTYDVIHSTADSKHVISNLTYVSSNMKLKAITKKAISIVHAAK